MIEKLEKKIVVERSKKEQELTEKLFNEALELNIKEQGLNKSNPEHSDAIKVIKDALLERKVMLIENELFKKLSDKYTEEKLKLLGYELHLKDNVINGDVYIHHDNPAKVIAVNELDQTAIEVMGVYFKLIERFVDTQTVYELDGTKEDVLLRALGYKTVKNDPDKEGVGIETTINSIGAAITKNEHAVVLHLLQLTKVKQGPAVTSHMRISLKTAQAIIKHYEKIANKLEGEENGEN